MSSDATTADHHHIPASGEPPHVHHMDSVTAYQSAKLGMWLFLATEILLFAVMFCSFAMMRWYHLEEFHKGSHHLNWMLGALNTVVLLISSWTAARAVSAAQTGDNSKVFKNFGFSILCGIIFLVIKTFEYAEKFEHGLYPGGAHFTEYKNFFGLYFCMTGLHALHVVIGMVILGWGMSLAAKKRFGPRYYTPVELGALYWHLVDLIWIYLFPLLYLVG